MFATIKKEYLHIHVLVETVGRWLKKIRNGIVVMQCQRGCVWCIPVVFRGTERVNTLACDAFEVVQEKYMEAVQVDKRTCRRHTTVASTTSTTYNFPLDQAGRQCYPPSCPNSLVGNIGCRVGGSYPFSSSTLLLQPLKRRQQFYLPDVVCTVSNM